MLGAKIANDRVGLPKDEAVIVDRRHQPVRIERPVFGRVVLAEGTADVFALEWNAKLAATPQHFLHVTGRRASQNLQHRHCPLLNTRIGLPSRKANAFSTDCW